MRELLGWMDKGTDDPGPNLPNTLILMLTREGAHKVLSRPCSHFFPLLAHGVDRAGSLNLLLTDEGCPA